MIAGCEATPLEAPTTRQMRPVATTARRGVERFIGVIVARRQVAVSLPVPARVEEMRVEVGDFVAEGAVLATLQTEELDAELEAADSALREAQAIAAQARVALRTARQEVRAVEKLVRAQAAASNQLRDARSARAQGQAELERSLAGIERHRTVRDQLAQLRERATLRAPLAGHVAARRFDAGATVAAEQPIVELMSQERDLRFAVRPERAPAFVVGAPVTAHLGATSWQASITSVAAVVDSASQLIFVQAQIGNAATTELPPVGTVVEVQPPAQELDAAGSLGPLDANAGHDLVQ